MERQTPFPCEVDLFDPMADNKFFRSQFFFQTLNKLDVFFDAFSSFFIMFITVIYTLTT
ncbi:MAG: hypothetical protein ACJA2S_004195 [Cyclobacteriaceae bacterium]|jgi:hypothetical protein